MTHPVWGFISGLVQPVADLIDNLHTSDEERLAVQAKLSQIQHQMTEKVMAYESRLLDAKASVITAEAQGQSWLQRNWRPITMLTFLVLVVADTFGLTTFRLAPEAWSLLQIGLGGYVVGRSVEKVVPHLKKGQRE